MPVSCRHLLLLGWLLGALLLASPAWSQQAQNAPPPPPASGPSPEDFVKIGNQKAMTGDLAGALTSFDQALQIDPRWVPALERKGQVLVRQRNYEDAIKILDQAVQIDPNYADSWYYRGLANAALARFDEAVADFSQVISLNDSYAPAYLGRGKVLFFKSDFSGTVADTTRMIKVNPQQLDSYYYRGLAALALNNASDAEADFQHCADAGVAYGAFWLWITEMENGQKDQARKKLSDFQDKHKAPPKSWTRSVGEFLLKKIKQEEFLNRADKTDPLSTEPCEAWFFIGINKRLAGDATGARDAFQKSISTGSTASVEYAEAQIELTKLPGE
jgi:tetratricopeptide (TPR) repeat protein